MGWGVQLRCIVGQCRGLDDGLPVGKICVEREMRAFRLAVLAKALFLCVTV